MISRHHRVDLRDLAFQPDTLRAILGDTVSWVNRDIVPHTVTAPGERWDSGELDPGQSFALVLNRVGVVRYLCRYHAGMTGVMRVR